MPTYNYGHFLEQAVESVLGQSRTDLELVVSDNASTDDTEALMRAYAERDPRVRYHRNDENVGLAANFSLVFERSDPGSRYFIGLPADDWWKPDLLAKLVGAAEAHPEATVVHSDIHRTDAEGAVLNTYNAMIGHDHPPAGPHGGIERLYRINFIPFQTALVRRADFERLSPDGRPYDPEVPNTNDYYLWLTLFTRGASGHFVDEALGYYRKHEAAQTMPANLIPRLQQEVRCFEKIAPICPPEFEGARRRAMAERLSSLAFVLLEDRRAGEARALLDRAATLTDESHLDRRVARAIARLPLSGAARSQLWRLALGAAQRLRSA
jgi:hypothetical protein